MLKSRIRLPLLGAATALGSLAIQMFVPAMPIMARELNASAGVLQLGIAIYLLGLTGGQLFSGAVADTYGRRPVLLIGILLFAAGSLLAGVAGNAPVLLAGRLLQALGGSMTLVAGRSIVADTTKAERASSGMAALALITLISPALAPPIGGALVLLAGWRSIFFCLLALALLVGAAAFALITETNRPSGKTPGLQSYAKLMTAPGFLRLAIGNGSLSMALYVFLTAAPFVMINRLGLTPAQAGAYLLWVALGVMFGTLAHRSAHLARSSVTAGKICLAFGLVTMLISGYFLPLTIAALVVPMCAIALGVGLCGPMNLALALNFDRTKIGAASSLFGAVQSLMSALASIWVAVTHPASLAGLALMMSACIVAAILLLPSPSPLIAATSS